MTLYAETSAVLRWLLGEPGGEAVLRLLASARRVTASVLTIVESERALVRLAGALEPRALAATRSTLRELADRWTLVEVDAAVRARAGQPFPVEPVRTLDALHLATALEVVAAAGPLRVLSVDSRVVANARALGLGVVP